MHKEQYSEDFQWYNQGVCNAITALNGKYHNAIPIFGSALQAYEYNPDLDKFVAKLPDVAISAKFYGWYEGVVGALYRFCHLCLIDPALIEAYIGMSFATLCEGV